jgi:hypothetical protein
MKIICQKCNVEISKQVMELDDLSLINENDGEAYIPEGFFIILTMKKILEQKAPLL